MPAEIVLSALVPAYNAERFLAEAVDSALSQTLEGVEVVIVNDGSTDSTGAIADRYAVSNPERVRVIHQQNCGLPLARNAAIENSRGTYCGLLDADDIWLSHHAARCVDVLAADTKVGLVHADASYIDADGKPLPMFRQPRWKQAGADPYREIFLRREQVMCPTAVFRRSLLAGIGMFDPRFNRLGCEDRDLWLRIAEVASVRYLDEEHAQYRLHGSNMSSKADIMVRARRLLVEKHAARPCGRPYRRQAIAAIEADRGHELALRGPAWPALEAFIRALAYDPMRRDAWRGLIRRLIIGHR